MPSAHTTAPRISLVICTRNRGTQLRRCLESVAKLQCAQPWELVIVDNGSTDDTPEVLRRFQDGFEGQAVLLHEETPGLARARNGGWRASRGAVVVFTDDDCYPDPHFLACTLRHFETDGELGYLGGRILLYDSQDYAVTLLDDPEPIELPAGRIIGAGTVQGANMALRRTVLELVGGFDQALGAGTPFPSEDIDIVARASALGWKGAYRPDVIVYHHHGRRSAVEVNQLMRSYDRGRGAYYAKCLLNPRIRRSALKHWFDKVPKQPLGQTGRELAAGLSFALKLYARRRHAATSTANRQPR